VAKKTDGCAQTNDANEEWLTDDNRRFQQFMQSQSRPPLCRPDHPLSHSTAFAIKRCPYIIKKTWRAICVEQDNFVHAVPLYEFWFVCVCERDSQETISCCIVYISMAVLFWSSLYWTNAAAFSAASFHDAISSSSTPPREPTLMRSFNTLR
jgi:hypothetical protein